MVYHRVGMSDDISIAFLQFSWAIPQDFSDISIEHFWKTLLWYWYIIPLQSHVTCARPCRHSFLQDSRRSAWPRKMRTFHVKLSSMRLYFLPLMPAMEGSSSYISSKVDKCALMLSTKRSPLSTMYLISIIALSKVTMARWRCGGMFGASTFNIGSCNKDINTCTWIGFFWLKIIACGGALWFQPPTKY